MPIAPSADRAVAGTPPPARRSDPCRSAAGPRRSRSALPPSQPESGPFPVRPPIPPITISRAARPCSPPPALAHDAVRVIPALPLTGRSRGIRVGLPAAAVGRTRAAGRCLAAGPRLPELCDSWKAEIKTCRAELHGPRFQVACLSRGLPGDLGPVRRPMIVGHQCGPCKSQKNMTFYSFGSLWSDCCLESL